MTLVNKEDLGRLSSFFRGRMGDRRAHFIMKILYVEKLNRIYARSEDCTGTEFSSRFLADIGVKYTVANAPRLDDLPRGAFITVSNHPYGGIDGLMLVDLIASRRPDYKVMVNKTLSIVGTMRGSFITVTSRDKEHSEASRSSMKGIRETLEHIRKGHPLGLFPSGAISDLSLRNFRVRDREWQEGVAHLVRMAQVPVIPVRFFDGNSALFYLLGLVGWRVRLLRLPAELFNKSGKIQRIGIGNLITVEQMKQYPTAGELGEFLRQSVYDQKP